MPTSDTDEPHFPSTAEICIERPLYASLELEHNGFNERELRNFVYSNERLDVFCPQCAGPTVIAGGEPDIRGDKAAFRMDFTYLFKKTYSCSRQPDHKFVFLFQLEEFKLTKVGQTPSMADIDEGHIREYRAVLEREHFKELSRAIGLASHGVGIGSFVYLRRIFERLVEEAHLSAKEDAGWDDATFVKSRMDDKILALSNHLPSFLVEQRSLYGILSLGIHALDEETCLSHFPVILAGIELILDQRIALKLQAKKLAEATKRIGQIHQQLKK